ncbi:hypothetical protein BLNAU_2257 [Blattamonas nauphoetae]|uniref:Right handed beta helix domain-containing protein n=1 Tax=Blattamonas nauphoetae TaxID=2049346 RepID=A0ABQ9YGD5_9EUKA|nr:hypothetical protein BLNAU_2257 [Blattamonas nauphoetae]
MNLLFLTSICIGLFAEGGNSPNVLLLSQLLHTNCEINSFAPSQTMFRINVLPDNMLASEMGTWILSSSVELDGNGGDLIGMTSTSNHPSRNSDYLLTKTKNSSDDESMMVIVNSTMFLNRFRVNLQTSHSSEIDDARTERKLKWNNGIFCASVIEGVLEIDECSFIVCGGHSPFQFSSLATTLEDSQQSILIRNCAQHNVEGIIGAFGQIDASTMSKHHISLQVWHCSFSDGVISSAEGLGLSFSNGKDFSINGSGSTSLLSQIRCSNISSSHSSLTTRFCANRIFNHRQLLLGSKICSCTNHFDGGVIRDMNAGGSVMISNTTFSRCTTLSRSRPSPNSDYTYIDQTFTSTSDRIVHSVKDIEEDRDSVTITGCSFTDVVFVPDESADLFCGGAIYLEGPFSSILINNSSFERCFVDNADTPDEEVSGMVVYLLPISNVDSVTISECSFSDYVDPTNNLTRGCVTLQCSEVRASFVFTKNTVDPKDYVANNESNTGLYMYTGMKDAVIINDNTFTQCSFFALVVKGNPNLTLDSLIINIDGADANHRYNSVFIEVHTSTVHSLTVRGYARFDLKTGKNGTLDIDHLNLTGGGPFRAYIFGTNLTMRGCVVNRILTGEGTALYIDGYTVLINSSSFTHNNGHLIFDVLDMVMDDVLIDNNIHGLDPVRISASSFKIYNSLVSNNHCTRRDNPGALYFSAKVNGFFSNTHFSNNSNANDPSERQTGSDIAYFTTGFTLEDFVNCSSTSKKDRIYCTRSEEPWRDQLKALPTNRTKKDFEISDLLETMGYAGFVIVLVGGLFVAFLFFFIFVICICECSVKSMQS